jgi:MYXO-CTERM domain-containing protein
VFGFQTQSAQALLSGQDPYSIHFDSIYNLQSTQRLYAPGDYSEDGRRLLFGYLYMPLALLLTLPGYLLGDIRYAMAAAVSITTLLLAFMRPGRLGLVAAAGLLFMPRTPNVIDLAWNEPLVVMLLALTVFSAIRLPKLTPYAFGLLLASKQYMPFAVVLSPLLFGWDWRRLLAALLRAGITALVVTLPLVLPDVGAFVHSAILFQFHQPFRREALSFLVPWFQMTGSPPSAVFGFLALVLVGAAALWRLRPSPANFTVAVAVSYFAFFAFNKQAFMNYYFFAIAALWCSVAALDLPPDQVPAALTVNPS